MRGTIFNFLLVITWPSLQALFRVTSEQASYEGELHREVRMGCGFTPITNFSELTVTWSRTIPQPVMEVFRLERGVENYNFTDGHFLKRARLLTDELKNFRAVLEISQLQMSDSGTYACVIRHTGSDHKMTSLTVRAPYSPVKKSVRKMDNGEVELSCESQGFPLANVVWNNNSLANSSSSHIGNTSEGTLKVTSRVTVMGDIISNYTCSFEMEGVVVQSATFNIPGEIPERSMWSHGFAAWGVIAVMSVGLAATSLLLHRRRKGQKKKGSISTVCASSEPNLTVTSADLLIPKKDVTLDNCAFSSEVSEEKAEKLREVLRRRYADLNTAEMKSGFTLQHKLLCGEKQYDHLQPIIPGLKETVLLEVKEGSGTSSLAQKLAFSWANNLNSDLFNIGGIRLVILVNFEGQEGDFFQVVGSNIPSEAGLETADVRDILLGNTDSLLVLDGYEQGNNREVDGTLMKFLKERSTSRVLITARPGHQLSGVGKVLTRTLQLHTQAEGS
ncbi:butyrophilin subfamily 1 member A1 isoform X1 [Salminus brasiliensis]|uniref:butyrophilin subfamily 1 member A1 isoform X1 n=1 Tax=Salminus brasiliensis TaxID=930266 RepID=UPI003B8335CD